MSVQLICGDCLDVLDMLPDKSVHCCVTSPPYYGLRDYGVDGQIGLEETPQAYVDRLVEVFREVRRVLAKEGTCWVNLGDSYANDGKWGGSTGGKHATSLHGNTNAGRGKKYTGLKPKDLIGIPWRVAFALQADGWWLRQDIIWHKPNPMPESVRDRCTKAHEYVFLLTKSERYFFDAEAIATPLAESSKSRLAQPTLAEQQGSARVPGKTNGNMKAVGPRFGGNKYGDDASEQSRTKSGNEYRGESGKANRRSVWSVTTKPFKGAHFATMPVDLAQDCIRAGCPADGVVFDPFGGAGTTAVAAIREHRSAILAELNPEYVALARARVNASLLEALA